MVTPFRFTLFVFGLFALLVGATAGDPWVLAMGTMATFPFVWHVTGRLIRK